GGLVGGDAILRHATPNSFAIRTLPNPFFEFLYGFANRRFTFTPNALHFGDGRLEQNPSVFGIKGEHAAFAHSSPGEPLIFRVRAKRKRLVCATGNRDGHARADEDKFFF